MFPILKTNRFFRCLCWIAILGTGFPAQADWINLTGAETAENIVEMYVLDDHVKVNLEVYVGDLDKFETLIPDDWLKQGSGERPSLEQRMQSFATNGLQFLTDDGSSLPAKLVKVEARERVDRQSAYAGMTNPLTLRPIRGAPADKRVMYVELIYPFERKPDYLEIVPPRNAQGGVDVNIGFVAYHHGVPIIDFRYLGQKAKLNLDWKDPWYSKFDNKNLSRHHKYPLMLYLYVEPRQVRMESLLRFGDIAELTEFDLDAGGGDSDKRRRMQEHASSYYARDSSLQVDGVSVTPDSVRVEFLHATLSGLKVIDLDTPIDEASLLVGVSQRYLITELPQKIDSRWPYFNQRFDRIPLVVTDPVGPLMSFIDRDDPEFGWENFLKKYSDPVIQPVEVTTGWSVSLPYMGEVKLVNWMPEQAEALEIVAAVFENVRVAFIEKDPDSFSRVLGQLVNTEQESLLAKELAKLFSPDVTGGGASSVYSFTDLKIEDMRELDSPDGFSATVSGLAGISAKHWGHIDARQFRFQLLLDLVEIEQQWRLADITVIDMKQGE